jgi:hypothetical protein
MAEYTSTKKKLKSDMAKLESLLMPAWAKKNMVVTSLKPKPPIEIGSKVIAPITGINIKK